MPRSKTKAKAKQVAITADQYEKERRHFRIAPAEPTETKEAKQEPPRYRLTEDQKKRVCSATLSELLMAAAEFNTKQDAEAISSDPEFKEQAVEALHEKLDNPTQFERKAKHVFKERKELAKTIGNGLPLNCRVFVFDFEMLHLQQDRGGFVDARIFQQAFLPLYPREKEGAQDGKKEEEEEFVGNVNPGIKWSDVHKQLQRYAKNAWGCKSLEECAKRASGYPSYPQAFAQWLQFLAENTDGDKSSNKHVLLIGFNSTTSDLLGLQAEMKRHALRWSAEIGSIWLWDCASFLRSKAQLQSEKWTLGLIYNTLTKKHMPNAHHAKDDAVHLRELLHLTLPGDDMLVCELASKQAFGVTMIGSAESEARKAIRKLDKAYLDATKALTTEQQLAFEFGERRIKEGQVKGLGRLHAARLRLNHRAELFHHLFDLYEGDDDAFLDGVVRKGITTGSNNMAKVAEQKLLQLAKDYKVPRDLMRRERVEKKEKAEAVHATETKLGQTRLQFLEQLEKRTPTDAEKLHRSVGALKEIQTQQQRTALLQAFNTMLTPVPVAS